MSIPKLTHDDITTQDLSQTTYAKLKQLLPEVFTEGQDGTPNIDIAKLKIALGGNVNTDEDNTTRYSFNWSGKKQAQRLANQPSTATLCPAVADSKNWDTTQNIYIEGDNLEVLKLLQKSYYGQVKMIYIDPPYNTGKDFVYKDNFTDNLTNYLQKTGQIDNEGNKIDTNTDKNGRYHTDWLNMMYPRLKLARNLLRDDGVIFISIDDNEVHNLRKICDEIFGEDNFIGEFVVNTTPNARDYGHIAKMHDYIIFYSKNIDYTITNLIEDFDKQFKYIDEVGEFNVHPLYNSNVAFTNLNRPNLYYPFYINVDNNTSNDFYEIGLSPFANSIEVFPPKSQRDGVQFVWRWGRDKSLLELNINIIGYKTEDGDFRIVQKMRTSQKLIRSLLLDKNYTTRKGTAEVEGIFDKKIFNFPKPLALLIDIVKVGLSTNDIILDFFSGSATTAHAVMQLNAEDGGNRKYICVQLPEPTPLESEARKAGYNTICEIGKERIRRAGDKILTQWQETHSKNDLLTDNNQPTPPDIGFKVFKLHTSNFKPVDTNDMLADTMQVLDNRTTLDVFYELTLKQGYSLDYPQTVLDIGGTKCYALLNPADNTPCVLAVLDDIIKTNFALELLKHHLNIVFIKDDCFTTDEAKLNTMATLEQLQNKDTALQLRLV